MSKVVTDDKYYHEIGDAIRFKNGKETKYPPSAMAKAIEEIPSGGIIPSGSVILTEEGRYDVTEKEQAIVDMSATRAALAEAVTAKGVDTLPDSSFDTIANHIGLIEGGGGLPTSISKIDGGSFTPSSDQSAETYRISHNLGELPKYCIVWTEELSGPTPVATNYALTYGILRIGSYFTTSTGEQYAMVNVHGRTTSGGDNSSANTGTQAQLANFASPTYFAVRKSGYHYEAGVTYKWLAWT